jgi:Rrf2 family protein
MKISAKTEYACIAMLELAAHFGSGEPVRVRRIAERHTVPPRFLVQILLQLKGAGLVASVRGAAGGYQLIRPPQEVSIGQVMEVIEGAPDDNGHTSAASPDSPAVKVLMQAWREVGNAEREMLNRITLADLLERAKGQEDQMYFI